MRQFGDWMAARVWVERCGKCGELPDWKIVPDWSVALGCACGHGAAGPDVAFVVNAWNEHAPRQVPRTPHAFSRYLLGGYNLGYPPGHEPLPVPAPAPAPWTCKSSKELAEEKRWAREAEAEIEAERLASVEKLRRWEEEDSKLRKAWAKERARRKAIDKRISLRLRQPGSRTYVYPPLNLAGSSVGKVIGLDTRGLWPVMSLLEELEAEFSDDLEGEDDDQALRAL